MKSGELTKAIFLTLTLVYCTSLTAGQHWSPGEQYGQIFNRPIKRWDLTANCKKAWCYCFLKEYPLSCKWLWFTKRMSRVLADHQKEWKKVTDTIRSDCHRGKISNANPNILEFIEGLKFFKKTFDRLNGKIEVVIMKDAKEFDRWDQWRKETGTELPLIQGSVLRTYVDAPSLKTLFQLFDCPCPARRCSARFGPGIVGAEKCSRKRNCNWLNRK